MDHDSPSPVEAVPGGMSRQARARASELALRAGRLWHHQAVGTRERDLNLSTKLPPLFVIGLTLFRERISLRI